MRVLVCSRPASRTKYEEAVKIDVTEKSPERWSRRDGKLEEDRIQRFTSNGFGKLGSPNHPSSSPDQSGQTFNFVGDVKIGFVFSAPQAVISIIRP